MTVIVKADVGDAAVMKRAHRGHDLVFAGKVGMARTQHAAQHANVPDATRGVSDIRNFFTRIPKPDVIGFIRNAVTDEQFVNCSNGRLRQTSKIRKS